MEDITLIESRLMTAIRDNLNHKHMELHHQKYSRKYQPSDEHFHTKDKLYIHDEASHRLLKTKHVPLHP